MFQQDALHRGFRDHESLNRGKIHQTGSLTISDDDSGCALEEYAWVPPGLTPKQVQTYFARLPENRVPYIDSEGEKWRCQQQLQQNPPQDGKARYCTGLSIDEERELEMFATQRNQRSFGRGIVRPYHSFTATACSKCNSQINYGEMMVTSQRAGHSNAWHPECFKCNKCEEHLVDLQCYYSNGQIYCGRHHAETIKPRCDACDEIIFADECTEAEGQHWHMRHFKCMDCDIVLGGQRYIMREKKPFCTSCFEQKFAEVCSNCDVTIGIDEGQMQYRGAHWHATDKCFACCSCQKSLLGLPFMPRSDAIYCSKSCADQQGQLIEPQKPLTQFVRHSLLLDQTGSGVNPSTTGGHNSTFEHLHGESKPAIAPKPSISTTNSTTASLNDSDYNLVIDDYLNESITVPTPSRRTRPAPTLPASKTRPAPPPPALKPKPEPTVVSVAIHESTSERNAMVTIAEQIETIDLRSPTKSAMTSVMTPPKPTPRKKVRGILKHRATDALKIPDIPLEASNAFSRGKLCSSSVRERASSGKTPKHSGYMSEIDPKQMCSKKLRRTKSTDLIGRKDKLYFEDHADWCSTCTSSSDDSDYDRWDEDPQVAQPQPALLAKSRPNPQRYTKSRQLSRSTSHGAGQGKVKSKGLPKGQNSSTLHHPVSEFIYFDDRYEVRRPDWILDGPIYAPDQPLATSTKKKKHRKRCVVQ